MPSAAGCATAALVAVAAVFTRSAAMVVDSAIDREMPHSSRTRSSAETCQQALDAYCNDPTNCLDEVHGKFSGPLFARYSGPGNREWRCYAADSLDKNQTQYESGGDYCTRQSQLSELNGKPPCNGTLPPVPPPLPPGPSDLPSVTVFPPGLGGIACFRIPAIVQTADGSTLLAFAEARHGSCSDDATIELATRSSTDGGATWSNLSFAVGNSSYMVGNPTAVALQNGSVALVYVKHDPKCVGGCGTGNGLVMTHDAGVTWSAPLDLSEDFGPASGGLPGPGTGLQLEGGPHDGRLLVISHHGAYVNDYVSRSDDGGLTWVTDVAPFPQMDEAALTQLPNGSVLANMRHKTSPSVGRAIAISHDGGETFSPIQFDPTLISPVCQGSIVSFGGATFFSNPASSSGRNHITIRRSIDNAQTWEASMLVHAGDTFGYSCLVKGALGGSGHVGGILFESANQTIAFSRFDLNFTDSS